MAENAADIFKTINTNADTGDTKVTLTIGIDPTLTVAQYNAARAAAALGYPQLRDYIASIKPGAGPWIDQMLTHPTDPSRTPTLRGRWVALVLQGGDL